MGEPQSIVKEMSLTRDDFGRGLGSALASHDYRVEGDRVVIETPGEDLTIVFEALPPRRLGLNFTTPGPASPSPSAASTRPSTRPSSVSSTGRISAAEVRPQEARP